MSADGRGSLLEATLTEIQRLYGEPPPSAFELVIRAEVKSAMGAVYESNPMPPDEVDDPPPMSEREWREYRRAIMDDCGEDVSPPRETAERMMPRIRWEKRMWEHRDELRRDAVRRHLELAARALRSAAVSWATRGRSTLDRPRASGQRRTRRARAPGRPGREGDDGRDPSPGDQQVASSGGINRGSDARKPEGNSAASSTVGIIIGSVIWIALMTWILYRGIEISARTQAFLLGAEVVILAIFAVVAIVKVYTGSPAGSLHVSASWFNPFDISFTALALGVLLGIFIYWGWDSGVAVNEESRNPTATNARSQTSVVETLRLAVNSGSVRLPSRQSALAAVPGAFDVHGARGAALVGTKREVGRGGLAMDRE